MAHDRDTTTTAPIPTTPVTAPIPAVPGQRVELSGTTGKVARLLDRWLDGDLTTTVLAAALGALTWPKLPPTQPAGVDAGAALRAWQKTLRAHLTPVLERLAVDAAPVVAALDACTWSGPAQTCPRCRQLLGLWWDTRHAAVVTVMTEVPARAHQSLTGGHR